ncbi:hypothetical protein CLV31_11597 [Algoriphagus aquaeductus]|uniref:Exostosin family protein n=1 Tax=Algoriphagus aquaeductus TaxID=475299 RepID=A0A326RMB0_9BACT|nr:hypothetical protein [Algoriphagus aquaeductus]PZV79137.1 hypothetical protein CLV31_11597 [Algoriphagus aquaeductus]
MQKLKVYFPQLSNQKSILFEIAERASDDSLVLSELGEENFLQVDDPKDADWILIPVFLTDLVSDEGRNFIRKWHDLALKFRKPFGLFSNSDLVIDPKVEHYFLFTPGSYASEANMIELPAFLSQDPLKLYFQGLICPIQKSVKPTLGFCGQATSNGLKTLKDYFQIQGLRLNKKWGKSNLLKVPFFLPAFERYKLLSYLEESDLIDTDFIYRTKYRAGAQTALEKTKVEKEFYQNIRNNLFTVCLRGMGNYSVRFFQTLAMGRIPILIDTDSKIPFRRFIKESEFYISIPYEKRNSIDEAISQFFRDKTSDELEDWQRRCRKVWEDYYQKDHLMKFLSMEMDQILKESFMIP